MDNVKNDVYYVQKIKNDLAFIVKHMNNVSEDDFDGDELLQSGMMFKMVQISENAKGLSEAYKKQNSNIPWTDITGLRNRIVHDYGNVDLSIVYDTLKTDIPELLKTFESD